MGQCYILLWPKDRFDKSHLRSVNFYRNVGIRHRTHQTCVQRVAYTPSQARMEASKNRRPNKTLYCVGADVKPCSIKPIHQCF